jgi:hypothetical protein
MFCRNKKFCSVNTRFPVHARDYLQCFHWVRFLRGLHHLTRRTKSGDRIINWCVRIKAEVPVCINWHILTRNFNPPEKTIVLARITQVPSTDSDGLHFSTSDGLHFSTQPDKQLIGQLLVRALVYLWYDRARPQYFQLLVQNQLFIHTTSMQLCHKWRHLDCHLFT